MLVPELLRLRGKHLELPSNRHPLWAALLTCRASLAASLRDAKVTLVQARTPATAWVAHAVARRLEVKCIATLHLPFVGKSAAEPLRRAPPGARRRADRGVGLCRARRAAQHALPLPSRLETIQPGINLDRFDPASVRADRVIRLAAELRVPDGTPSS